MEQSPALGAHGRALIMQRRCAWCAESVPASVLLRGAACPRCKRVSQWSISQDATDLIGALNRTWSGKRWWFYGLLGVSTFATGMFPLAATLLTVAAMIYARIAIVREALTWFSPARRFTTRFTLRLWLLSTALLALVGNELLTLVPWANMPLKMMVSLASASMFVEGSLAWLRGRLKREASTDASLQWWEWALPVGLIGGATGLTIGAVAVGMTLWSVAQGLIAQWNHWLANLF